eukprot:CAMPEP_0170389392 /NCGR_PEP_ID=MMETSP0117_2-20130122/18591_1 /TAXON_ID=400756 /ORGANISM="Durinskia baltica, Strain CSIRO CS-38" /LENGTH=681 /DNA_ID=CAMNT_0010645373 /DNA_START=155 /DNA_END=2200 /DNA_ORIENTATION=-
MKASVLLPTRTSLLREPFSKHIKNELGHKGDTAGAELMLQNWRTTCVFGNLKLARGLLCFGHHQKFVDAITNTVTTTVSDFDGDICSSDKDVLTNELQLLLNQDSADIVSCSSYYFDDDNNGGTDINELKNMVATVTAVNLERWPVMLSRLPVSSSSVLACLDVLEKNSNFTSAASLIKVYPQHLTRQRFLSLVDRLQAYPLDDSRIVIVGELLNTIYKAREKAQTSIDAAEDTMYRCDFLSEEELNELSKEFLLRCMEVCTKKSLDAAFCTAEIFKKDAGIMELLANAQERSKAITWIKKGKWQLLKQVVANKPLKKKCMAYECLVELGMFNEANVLYKNMRLHGLVTPVTERQLKEQILKNESEYLQFPLKQEKIVIVNSIRTIQMAALSLKVSLDKDFPLICTAGAGAGVKRMETAAYKCVVGLDAEWEISMYDQSKQKLGASILQISSLDQVFILDFRGLFDHNASKSSEMVQMIQRFMRNLLSDPDILKVGWEFCNSDVHMLMKNCNGLFSKVLQNINSYVELRGHVQKVYSSSPQEKQDQRDHMCYTVDKEEEFGEHEMIANKSPISVESLSGACHAFLGRPLLKSEQLSDWDRRPLTTAQLTYASMDAHSSLALLHAVQLLAASQETVVAITTLEGNLVTMENANCHSAYESYKKINANKPVLMRRRGPNVASH